MTTIFMGACYDGMTAKHGKVSVYSLVYQKRKGGKNRQLNIFFGYVR